MHKVIKKFVDIHDDFHLYHEGDVYPRDGLSVTDACIAQLSSSKNRQGVPLIAAIPEKKNEGLNSAKPAQPKVAEQVSSEVKKPTRKARSKKED